MSIVFIKRDDNYYFYYGDNLFTLNENNFASLKNKITLPLEVYFDNCGMDFVGTVVDDLFDESIDISVNKVSKDNEDLKYKAVLSRSKGMRM